MYRGVGNGLGFLFASEAAAYGVRAVKELNQTYQEDGNRARANHPGAFPV